MPFRTIITAILPLIVLAACSGDGENPRISMCRDLAAKLSKTDDADWHHVRNRFVRPEYAAVSVSSGGAGATCYYAYEAVEESGLDLATPLLAYATLPYRVDYDGHRITGNILKKLVSGQQITYAKQAVDQAREAAQRASAQIERTLRD